MNAQDIREFSEYLRLCTDSQVRGVWEKETKAGREEFAVLAELEAKRRGMEVT